MITLIINGTPFEFFKQISASRSIENFSGTFSAVATESDIQKYPIRVNDKCVVSVNNYPFLTGYVESVEPSTGAYAHEIRISGRDLTCDIIDSTLLAKDIEMTPPFTLAQLIEKVQSALSLALPIVITAPIEPFDASDYASADNGKNAWDFIDEHARKKQVLVNTDGDGKIICMRSDQSFDFGLQLINKKGYDSNVLESSSSYNSSSVFGQYVCTSQGNLSLQGDGLASNDSLVTVTSTAVIDKTSRISRKFVFVAEQASSVADAQSRALWQANMNRARAITYKAKIDGCTYQSGEMAGRPYDFNHQVTVVDENEDINAVMLIKAVTINMDINDGNTTEFEIVDLNSYKLELSDPSLKDSRVSNVGNSLRATPTQEEIDNLIKENADGTIAQ